MWNENENLELLFEVGCKKKKKTASLSIPFWHEVGEILANA